MREARNECSLAPSWSSLVRAPRWQVASHLQRNSHFLPSILLHVCVSAPAQQVEGKKETERTTTSPLCLHHVEGEQTDLWSGCTSHDYNKAVMVNTSSQGSWLVTSAPGSVLFVYARFGLFEACNFFYSTDFSWQLPCSACHRSMEWFSRGDYYLSFSLS